MPECDYKFSNYLQVEYDCVPDYYVKTPMCGQTFYQKKGLITSPSYPEFDPNLENCKAKIIVRSGSIIKAYIKEISLDDE